MGDRILIDFGFVVMSIHSKFPLGVVPRNLFEERSDISLNGVTRNDMLNSLRHIPGGTASLLVTLGIVPRFPLEESQFMKERTLTYSPG